MDKVFYVIQFKSYYQPIWRDVDEKGIVEGNRFSDAKKLLKVYEEEERHLAEFKETKKKIPRGIFSVG